MKKVDEILRRADVFDKLSKCEDKTAMKKIIAQEYHYSTDTIDPKKSIPNQSKTTIYPNPSPNSNSIPKFQAPASLSNKDDIIKFQQNLSNYVKTDPDFSAQLNKALGGIPWGQGGKNKDIDGIRGERTMKAWNLYKQYAETSDPNVAMHTKQEEATTVGAQLLNKFREKLGIMRQKIAENTNNFQNPPKNIGSDKIKTAWMPFFQPEYGQLYAGYNQFPSQMQKEFTNLALYMTQLFGSYMKAPPAEPKSLIDVSNVKYTPSEI